MTGRVAVFAREPRLGSVKTRLASRIGEDRALACYIETLEIAIEAASGQTPEIWYEGQPVGSWIDRGLSLKQQSEGDLGTRMYKAFCDGVDIVIGSDIPLISAAYVEQAVNLLAKADVVLGPTEDGGYCLIGVQRPIPQLFRCISWSTHFVLDQTLQIASRLMLQVELLPTLWDIDDLSDYRRWTAVRKSVGNC